MINSDKKPFTAVAVKDDGLGGTSLPKPQTPTYQQPKPKQQTTNQTAGQTTNRITKGTDQKKPDTYETTAVTADDFLRGFNKGYEDELPTQTYSSQQTTNQAPKPLPGNSVRKNQNSRGITAVTADDFLRGFNKGYEEASSQETEGKDQTIGSIFTNAWDAWLRNRMFPDPTSAAFEQEYGPQETRAGNVMVGSGMDYAGQFLSAAGTAIEGLAKYLPAYGPYQNEIEGFNPSTYIPERDTTLITEYVSDPLRERGAELSEKGQTMVQEQKEGLGKFGQFAVDLGSAATQMVLDIGFGVATGGGMALPAAIRTFGSSATKAEMAGADLDQQMLYATTSAAASYGIEQMCNVAFAGLNLIAPGVSDDIVTAGVEKLAQKLASTPKGAQALTNIGKLIASGASEGVEETLESLLQPFLQQLSYDKSAQNVFQNPKLLADAVYEGVIGGILGMFGSGTNTAVDLVDNLIHNNIMPGEKLMADAGVGESEVLGAMVLLNLEQADGLKDGYQVGQTFGEASDTVVTDGSHWENGQLKSNITYKTGEHNYIYQTNENGLISCVIADDLQFKTHDGRLKHNPNTYGKLAEDHAGHLIGDQFGGSPELDNLVSQAKNVNMSEYKVIENQWAAALKNGQKVSVKIDIKYDAGNSRPTSFSVVYEIDGVRSRQIIMN